MRIKIRGTAEGAVADIIEPGQGSGVEDSVVTSIAVPSGKELLVNLPTATVIEQVEYGDVVDSPAASPEAPVDEPGGGNEGSAAGDTPGPAGGEGAGPTTGEGEGGGAPASGEGGGEQPASGEGEAPTTSAASEKPLYLVDGDTIPEGFEPSGLETPDGKALFHFASDTAGGPTTGNADGVSVYAESADNDKPVQAAAPSA